MPFFFNALKIRSGNETNNDFNSEVLMGLDNILRSLLLLKYDENICDLSLLKTKSPVLLKIMKFVGYLCNGRKHYISIRGEYN